MFFSRDNHVFEIVGVYRATRQRFRKDSFARSHSSIGIRLSGRSELSYDGKSISTEENQLIYIPSRLKYSQRSESEEFISVCFIEHGETPCDVELLELPSDSEIKKDLIRLYEVWSAQGLGYRLECQAILYGILHEAYLLSNERVNASSRAFEILTPAVNYIYESYKLGSISVAHLARLCYISETYFRRLFKQAYGSAPVAFINALRIDTASALIESGDFSIADAAAAAGFADPKYFSREFRRAKGVSPAKYFKTK